MHACPVAASAHAGAADSPPSPSPCSAPNAPSHFPQGCLAPIKVVIPPRCLLNPSPEAAVVGGNVLTSQRVTDVVLRAFGAAAASQVRRTWPLSAHARLIGMARGRSRARVAGWGHRA